MKVKVKGLSQSSNGEFTESFTEPKGESRRLKKRRKRPNNVVGLGLLNSFCLVLVCANLGKSSRRRARNKNETSTDQKGWWGPGDGDAKNAFRAPGEGVRKNRRNIS